ncbi:ribosome assembly factor SBDS [Methanopyrus kandleri]|uniref:Ribosome maturation protein SDO1 homolog n=2 Tax=Methanopyrus kandleri TaxID=2320 RepID=Q8TYB8_METKA|nr:ribosome assembly factor SBDS [Methanopyrus kandleri]AAM01599.1 Predicted exosome subunit [Methanopyrus kandleri AV19]HII70459.1 ribosome assembly factor SBDS [Methanopyrus kandleri]
MARVSLEDAVVARLEKGGERFEVLVDPEGARKFREGEDVDVEEILAVEQVFRDARKGERASEQAMEELFGTSDPIKVAEIVIKEGEIQLTAEQRRRMQEEVKRKIIHIIARRAVDPRTGAPHPPERIERAMEEAGVHIDPMKSAEEQVKDVIKQLRPVLPMKFEEVKVAIRIPAKYTGQAMGVVREFGDIEREEWQYDGAWVAVVRLPAGLQDEFFEKLNEITKGDFESKILERESVEGP